MAKEIMDRRASDNKYLHRDFHNFMNLGINYVQELYGEEGVREYLRDFAMAFYAPLKEDIKKRGLAAIKDHYEKIYAIEEASNDVEFTLSEDELIIKVNKCPAVTHIRSCGIEMAPLYYETFKTTNEVICEGSPFAYELVEYDKDTGRSLERFYRKEK
ncbi:MAG TPA: hypothetical protein GXX20_07060 [Clostridiaceae bacterium]|nr:hypothetical protein [Clostridiaceae bacterium]